jgi:hypothetical protein
MNLLTSHLNRSDSGSPSGVRVFISSYLAALTITLLILIPDPAIAHTPSNFYYYTGSTYGKWPSNVDEPWYIRSGWPNSTTYYDRLKDAAWTWTSTSSDTNDMEFVYSGTTASGGNAYDACATTYSAAYWALLDVGTAGQTSVCKNTNTLASFQFSVAINNHPSITWYSGLGPTAYLDLLSVATHEFGHATSWLGHYNLPVSDASACPGTSTNTAWNTMCSGYAPGLIYKRSLEAHDVHTYTSAW